MTRSVTIVNSSNWDGEDYIVRARGTKIAVGKWPRGDINHEDGLRLRPGESVSFTPEEGERLAFESVQPEDGIKPFYHAQATHGRRDDVQVVPTVKVEFE